MGTHKITTTQSQTQIRDNTNRIICAAKAEVPMILLTRGYFVRDFQLVNPAKQNKEVPLDAHLVTVAGIEEHTRFTWLEIKIPHVSTFLNVKKRATAAIAIMNETNQPTLDIFGLIFQCELFIFQLSITIPFCHLLPHQSRSLLHPPLFLHPPPPQGLQVLALALGYQEIDLL